MRATSLGRWVSAIYRIRNFAQRCTACVCVCVFPVSGGVCHPWGRLDSVLQHTNTNANTGLNGACERDGVCCVERYFVEGNGISIRVQ